MSQPPATAAAAAASAEQRDNAPTGAGSPSTIESFSISPKHIELGQSTAIDMEKNRANSRYPEHTEGDLQVKTAKSDPRLKLARDGETLLIPQPSDDPNDPLNWSFAKKHLVLATLIYASYLTDFGITYGVPLFAAQTSTFHMPLPQVAHSISGALFMQGAGGILVVPLVQRLGRLPVLFWSQFLTCIVVTIAAVSPNYAMFTAFRTLQGFVNTAPQVIGLTIVHDLFFFHERARRVNLWVFCFAGGPSLGPFIAAWLSTAISWQATYGVLAAFHVVATVFVVCCGDETLYDRGNPQLREPGWLGRAKLLVGVTGAKATGRPTLWNVSKHLAELQFKPHLFFISVVFTTTLFAWVIGVTSTSTEILVPPPYNFSQQGIALSFLAPLIGALVGEAWGHFFNDWLCKRYIRKHGGVYVLENRLWGAYAPTLVAIGALILFGESLKHSLHWSAPLVAWGALTWSLLVGTTVISAYTLDSFPNHACLVSGIVNLWRTAGGFSVNYFQLPWIEAVGPVESFGLQAMILGVAFIVGIVLTQACGRKWRRRYLPPPAEN